MDRPDTTLTPTSQASEDNLPPEGDRRTSEEIRADIARERERMDLRLAELRRRLEPATLAANARDAVLAKGKRARLAAVEVAKRRPVAASLLAGGALALLAGAIWRRR